MRDWELLRRARAVAFFMMTMVFAVLVLLTDLILLPYTFFFDPTGYIAYRLNAFAVSIPLSLFINVEAEGLEHLPKEGSVVFASNHQSTLDAFVYGAMAHHMDMRVIYKAEMHWWPIIGVCLMWAKHVSVNRSDPDSRRKGLADMVALIKSGVSGLFFPEGTRYIPTNAGGAMKKFKPGAAMASILSGADIVPVTLSGVRVALPMHGFPSLGWSTVRIRFHPPISTKGMDPSISSPDVDKVMLHLRDVIASGLRPCDWYAGKNWEADESEFTRVFEESKAAALKGGATEQEAYSLASIAANEAVGIPRDVEGQKQALDDMNTILQRIKEKEEQRAKEERA